MIKPVYAVKDVKTNFWPPHVQINEPAAIREFSTMINSGDHFVTQNYADLELWQLGTYDDVTGVIESDVHYVASGRDFVKVGDVNE